ncbi:peroxiredoxin family protein [Paenisporosarcina cavernae]|uniref:TlpA family protein disulfide reductase n=1 Tax=Paenisporosarcina cavernae TaxID=2320858 RepID=A0A385YR64_9BACL|nr:TlpA family protein disulfide reductase [Paenisporosarcina cavernae]AYC28981.1 TlpA family protein disulfide reductase [Paenisporosarcina cavernae]
MKKKIFGLVLVGLLIVIALVSYIKQESETRESALTDEQLGSDIVNQTTKTSLKEGGTPPDFTLQTLDGEKTRLSDYKGKKVIVNFWATWCPPCKAEMPHMQNFYEDHAEEMNTEILAVNLLSSDSIEQVEEFVGYNKLTFPILLDEEGTISNEYEALTIPTSFLINTDGTIAHRIVGPMDEDMMINLLEGMD